MIKGAKIAIYDVLTCFINKFTKKIDSQLYYGLEEARGTSLSLLSCRLSSGFSWETLFKVELMMHSFYFFSKLSPKLVWWDLTRVMEWRKYWVSVSFQKIVFLSGPAPDDLTFRNDTFVSPINRERKAVWREIGKRVAINKAIVSPSKRHWNLIIENLAERQKNIQRYSTADLLGSQKYPGWIYPVNNNPAFILSQRLGGFEISSQVFLFFKSICQIKCEKCSVKKQIEFQ